MKSHAQVYVQMGAVSAAIALALVATVRVVGAGETTDRVRRELDRITAVLRDPALEGKAKEDERKAKVKGFILQWFDVQEMARRSLASHWATRSEKEREEFVGLFGDLFVESYTRLVVDHLADQEVVYLSETDNGPSALVKTKFLSRRGEPTHVDFVLFRRDGPWSAYDVVIDDVSIVGNYRTQFDKIIRAHSYDALVRRMRFKHESEGLGSSS